MLKAALCGGYVNFGVFSLYGDDALEKALKTFVELLSSIPHNSLLVCSRSFLSPPPPPPPPEFSLCVKGAAGVWAVLWKFAGPQASLIHHCSVRVEKSRLGDYTTVC